MTVDPTTTFRLVAREVRRSHETIKKALKLNKFHFYKIQTLQHLLDDNFDDRSKLCATITDFVNVNQNILHNTCFSDNAFCLNKHDS